jgi:hypothetical protein
MKPELVEISIKTYKTDILAVQINLRAGNVTQVYYC